MTTDTLRPEVNLNAPCPCGSGRKYRRCCWAARRTEAARADAALRDAPGAPMRFARERFPGLLERCWEDSVVPIRDRVGYRRLGHFLERAGDLLSVNVIDSALADEPVADGRSVLELFLSEPAAAGLHPVGRAFLEAWAGVSLSLYEVEEVVPGERLVLKDHLNEQVLDVVERHASRGLDQWDTVVTRVTFPGDEARLSGALYHLPRFAVPWFRERLEEDRARPEHQGLSWPAFLRRRWRLVPQLWLSIAIDPDALPSEVREAAREEMGGHVHGPGCGHEHDDDE